MRCGRRARAGGEDIIDLGMGNPDLPPPPHVIDKLIEVARKPDAHGYSPSKGIPGLRHAQANYHARRFGVDIDPETEVVVTHGLEGRPGQPRHTRSPRRATSCSRPTRATRSTPSASSLPGATIRCVPTTPGRELLAEALERAMAFTVPRPSVLVVGYPSNPTAEAVDLAFYERRRGVREGEQALGALRPGLFGALL